MHREANGDGVDALRRARRLVLIAIVGMCAVGMMMTSPVGAQQMATLTPVGIGQPIAELAFRLDIPFRTQKDGGRWQNSNCGPAVLGMILDAYGITGHATDDLRFRAHRYQGTVGMRTGTALEHIAHVAEDFGVRTVGLYDPDGRFHTWSVDEIRDQIRRGNPVMMLVRLYLLPGREGTGVRWGHYILLTGVVGDEFIYSDSLQTDLELGPRQRIPSARLDAAIGNSHIPGQGLAFVAPPTRLALAH